MCLYTPDGQCSCRPCIFTYKNQKVGKTTQFNQNTNYTNYNKTSERARNPGRHSSGVKIKHGAKNVILDSSCIAGVNDYEEEFDDDDYDKEEEE